MAERDTKVLGWGTIVVVTLGAAVGLGVVLGVIGGMLGLSPGITGGIIGASVGTLGAVLAGRRRKALEEKREK